MRGKTLYSHPLSLIGYCAFFGGWLWLLGGSSSDVGLGRNIINIHGTMLSIATILSGIGLILAGMISVVGNQFSAKQDAAETRPTTKQRTDKPTSIAKEPDEAELLRRQMMERGINV